MNITKLIAALINAEEKQVTAAVGLLDEGASVPFIARYRKEKTGGLDDAQLRLLEDKLGYFRELLARQQTILQSIDEQGKLSETLKEKILATTDKARLEDLYLPYKPKRRTKGQIAIEAGLLPLADKLQQEVVADLEALASQYVNTEKDVADTKAALEGARYILMERFAEHADLLAAFREKLWLQAQLVSAVVTDKETEGAKFKDYFEYNEALHKIPSHRALALLRGQKAGVLRLKLELTEADQQSMVERIASVQQLTQFSGEQKTWLDQVCQWTLKTKMLIKLELELMSQLRQQAEADAIDVFAKNLKELLLAAPAGEKVTLGLDPGLRTGIKAVVVDGTSKLLAYETIFPLVPHNKTAQAAKVLLAFIEKYHVELISIGNGTGSRETDEFVAALLKEHRLNHITKIVVSEAGASVYSASSLASEEFPDLDVSYRGAVSIARRLQDPLAELIKIDPKAIGVGQYQHDVNQIKLKQKLNAVLEDCVNAVGVELNQASVPLLTSVSGLNKTMAENIVRFREQHGRFNSRQQLLEVPQLGPKAFEQAAGFLRIRDADNPLDASAVHPEAYALVQQMADTIKVDSKQLIRNHDKLTTLNPQDFISDAFGLVTIKDILQELEKPARDPRPEFKVAKFADHVHDVKDLTIGMQLEGVVSNVTHFGAFVDIGVHQDGLVHVSELANHFVSDPSQVVKVGDIVQVRVLSVDEKLKRISLSMKTETDKPKARQQKKPSQKAQPAAMTSSIGLALQEALSK